MDNFGVIELASTKTTNAPGWAYVPDRQGHHLAAAGASTSSTSNRTRGRNAGAGGAATSSADLSARRDAKARREIEILDEDNPRGVQIAIPPKPGGGGGSSSSSSSRTAAAAAAGGKKHTPNVRRILQSQKTFANHLDDYMALLAQQDANPNTTAIPSSATTAPANLPGASEPTATRRGGQRQVATSKKPSTAAAAAAAARREVPADQDVEMHDAPSHSSSSAAPPPRSAILTAYDAVPARLEGDDEPLLASRLPPLPNDGELRALLAAPPLGYLEARGAWPPQGGGGSGGPRYPVRVFCAICGYWGRERCLKCGTRVCALDCLEIHREECVTRYGL